MDCRNIQRMLSGYLEGDISSGDKMLIEKHLISCEECTRSLSELKQTIEHVHNLEDVEPPPWMTQKIMAKIESGTEQKKGFWQKLVYPLHIKLPIEVAAVVLAATIAIYVFKIMPPEMKSAKAPSEESTAQKHLQEEELKTKEIVDARDEPLKRSHKPHPEYKAPQKDAPPPSAHGRDFLLGNRDGIAVSPLSEEGGKEVSPPISVPLEKRDEVGFDAEPKAPAPVAKQEQAMPSAGAVAGDHSKHGALSAEPRVKFSAERKKEIFRLIVQVDDIDTASQQVEKIVMHLGGIISRTEYTEDKDILNVELASKDFKELIEKLRRLGEIEETEVLSEAREGVIGMRIEIVRILK